MHSFTTYKLPPSALTQEGNACISFVVTLCIEHTCLGLDTIAYLLELVNIIYIFEEVQSV